MARLPLLELELFRRASQRRTYMLRVAWGLGLLWVFGLDWPNTPRMGRGDGLVLLLVGCQLLGTCLIVPPLLAGAVVGEREARTLDLLRVSGLTPRQLLGQKLLGGLVTAWSHVLLGFPLLALAYVRGGVSRLELLGLTSVLVLAPLQVGTLTLWCSVTSRTPRRALLATYYLLVWGLGLGLLLLGMLLGLLQRLLWWLGWLTPSFGPDPWLSHGLLLTLAWQGVTSGACWRAGCRAHAVERGIDKAAPTTTPRRRTAEDVRPLFGDEPVAWLVKQRGASVRVAFLGVVFIYVWAAILPLCGEALGQPQMYGSTRANLHLAWLAGGLAAPVLIAAMTAAVIGGQRRRGTLEPLLVTRLDGSEIVRQAQVNGRQAAGLALAPLTLVALAQAWLTWPTLGPWRAGACLLLALSLLVVGLRLAIWIASVVGMRVRHHAAPVVASLIGVLLLAPGQALTARILTHVGGPLIPWAVGLLTVQLALLRFVRALAHREADRLLGRQA